MRYSGRKSQSGFTLVEIAIVLVIIGLLLGGVLKGTELIENSKVKRAVNEINGISAAYYSYVDRYQRVPGDDTGVTSRGSNWATVTSGDGDGLLDITRAQVWNAAGEQVPFWQQVRASGLVTGDPTAAGVTALPRNAFGGLIGMVAQAVNGNLQGTKVCLSQVPGKSAMAIDAQLDDGNIATGRTRSTAGGANPANTAPNVAASTVAYTEDNYYTVCTQI